MRKSGHAGFSLIELMVALVAGLIVIGAVLSFVVTTVRSNTQTTQATRVMQELRTSMGLISRELRRAGYNQNAIDSVGTNSTSTVFATITTNLADDCVVVAYDRGGAPGAIDTGESRGFRRIVRDGVGLLQASLESTAASCSGGQWVDLTDPRTLNVTAFAAVPTSTTVAVSGADVAVRDVQVTLRGQSLGVDPIAREIRNRIRVRADCVDFAGACPAP
jgi:prepilin-type N-terminal cleavage/methylation domain-containing protein